MNRKKAIGLLMVGGMISWGVFVWLKNRAKEHVALQYTDLTRSNPYDEVARATGGRVYRPSREEFQAAVAGGVSPVLEDMKTQNFELLASLEGNIPGGAIEIPFHVDPTIRTLAIRLTSLEKVPEATLLSSKDQIVSTPPTEAGKSGRNWTLNSPEPGLWRLRLTGQANIHLEIRGESRSELEEVYFVRERGRPGHTGMFRYSGRLKPGTQESLEVRLEGGADFRDLDVSLLSRSGERLGKGRSFQVAERSASSWIAYPQVEIPREPFRVSVGGRVTVDGKEFGFQRLSPMLFEVGSPEMKIFSFQKGPASEDLCRRMTLGKLQVLSAQDPVIASYGASVSVSCVNLEGKLHYTGTFFVPVPEEGENMMAFTTLLSEPLTVEECATAAEIHRHVPSRLGEEGSHLHIISFHCEKRANGIFGVLRVRVSSGS